MLSHFFLPTTARKHGALCLSLSLSVSLCISLSLSLSVTLPSSFKREGHKPLTVKREQQQAMAKKIWHKIRRRHQFIRSMENFHWRLRKEGFFDFLPVSLVHIMSSLCKKHYTISFLSISRWFILLGMPFVTFRILTSSS